MAGGAGAVDEASVDLLAINGFNVSFQNGKAGSATVRYTIPVLRITGARLTAALRHAGTNDRIVARLRRFDLATGAAAQVLVLDTDTLEPDPQMQTAVVDTCEAVFPPPGSGSIFVLEVTLSRTLPSGTNPVWAGFQIALNPDCIQ
jgi:hypothetical protein